MQFEWDEGKRRKTIVERDVDILKAARIFESRVLRSMDARRDYGEVRYRAVGLVDGECYVLVYTQRGDSIRLITAWKGGRNERREYQASLA